jgi:hypothetical protein
MAHILKLTTAGRAALVAPNNAGTAARLVAQVGITPTAFAFDAERAALPDEIKRVATISGAVVAADTIHLTVRDDTPDAFTVRGLGLYLDDGTLLGTYSQAEPILIKASASVMLLAFDAKVLDGSVDISQLTFGNTNFLNPPATQETAGIVRMADMTETIAGISEVLAVSPRWLKFVLKLASTEVNGLLRLANLLETAEGLSESLGVTPKGLHTELEALKTSINSASKNISVITGTIVTGGVLPLPAGYTQEQCVWMVAPDNLSTGWFDVQEGGANPGFDIRCKVNPTTRVVDVHIGFNGTVGNFSTTTANYIVIGTK